MARLHTFATIAPSLLLLLVVHQMWSVVEVLPHCAVFVFLLSLLPLAVQLCLLGYRQSRQGPSGAVIPPHPFSLVLPLALLLVIPFWPAGEWVATQVPALCTTVAGERVMTGRPESPTRKASFSVQVHGWGNRQSFGFTGGVIVYTGQGRRFEDLYFDFERQRGHWTNSYTTFFPLTREVVGEYVRRSDDFPPGEAEVIKDQLWDVLNRYAEKRDMPPMIDQFHKGEEPRIVYYVPASTIYLSASVLAVVPLATVSWLLARRYHRRILHAKGERLPD
jgi:hypothetical protein